MVSFIVRASCAVGPCTDTGTGSNALPVWIWIAAGLAVAAIVAITTILSRRGH